MPSLPRSIPVWPLRKPRSPCATPSPPWGLASGGGPAEHALERNASEHQKAEAEHTYLADTLDAMLAGKAVPAAERDVVGCLINFPAANEQHAGISYSETIAPMLQENCTMCHSPGGIAPWAMTGYDMVRGFAPMIREVVMTQRMPPWHADPGYGPWRNDRSLDERHEGCQGLTC